MQIIGLQLDSVWENKAANHDKVLSLLDKAGPQAGALVVLPEMFATGFSMNVAAIHDESRETQDFSLAAAERNIYLMGGVVMRDEATGRGRNEAVVYSPEGREVAAIASCSLSRWGANRNITRRASGYVSLSGGNYGGAIHLLRPEIPRTLSPCRARRKLDRSHRQLAGRARRPLGDAAQGARDRESGIRRRRQPLRPGPEALSPGRSVIYDPHGRVMADAGGEEGWSRRNWNCSRCSIGGGAFPRSATCVGCTGLRNSLKNLFRDRQAAVA